MPERTQSKDSHRTSYMSRESDDSEKIERLEKLLLLVIDETLKNIFKEAGAKAIYNYIETRYQLNQSEIVEKPTTFSTSLAALLGSAAPVIEDLILKNLHRKLDIKFEKKRDYRFSDYVMELTGEEHFHPTS